MLDPLSRANYGNLLFEASEQLIARGHSEEGLACRREALLHYERVLGLNTNHKKAHDGRSYVHSAWAKLRKSSGQRENVSY